MPPKTFVIIVSLIWFLFAGCTYVEYNGQWPPAEASTGSNTPPAFNEEIFIRPDYDFFESGEPITGIYTNQTSKTVYVFYPDGGGDNPLQKWNGKNWENIYTKPEGVAFIQRVSYRALKPGESRKILFPEHRLREKGKEIKGTYRFSFTITTDRELGNNTTIHSREFTIR